MKKRTGWYKGQSLVIVTLVLTVVLGALALVFDVGVIYFNWIAITTGTDAASLAGTNYLPSQPDQAVSTANAYALKNGIQQSEIQSIQVDPTDNKKLTVTVVRVVPSYFLGALSFVEASAFAAVSAQTPTQSNGFRIGATAKGAVQPAQTAGGAMPIGLDSTTTYTYGQMITLHNGVGAGNWESLALGGTGASNLSNNIENGYQGYISISDMVSTEPGNTVGPVRTAIQYRIDQGNNAAPSGTWNSHALNDPRVMLLPMINFGGVLGTSIPVPVTAFAVVWVASVDSHANITGYFIRQAVPNSKPDPNAADQGAYSAVLVG